MIFLVFVSLVFVYLSVNLILVAARNAKAHQFLKTKTPWLPVAPGVSLFSGHLYDVALNNKNWKIIEDLHRQLGKSFGIYIAEQACIVTKDIDLLKHVELDAGQTHFNRYEFYFPIKEMRDSIMLSNNEDWRRCRRVISPALTNHRVCSDEISHDLRQIVKQLEASLEKKLDDVEKQTGKRSLILDVDDAAQRFSLAVIFSIAYKQVNLVDFDSKQDFWVDWINRGLLDATNLVTYLGVMFPFLRPIFTFLIRFHSIGRMRDKSIAFLIKVVEMNRQARKQYYAERNKLESGREDSNFSSVSVQGDFRRRMVDAVIDAYFESKITYDDLMGNMWGMLMAGYTTTADSLTCLIWHLALQPEIQEKLRKSIIEEGIEGEYLMWCINEAVRWHPPVPLGAGRILKNDITVNGKVYPAGAYIFPTIRSVHRDESIWPEADKFKPERWSEQKSFHPGAFMGFGLGPRNCPGGKLAIHEMKLALQMLLMKYRFEVCEETEKEYEFSSPLFVYTILDKPIKLRLISLK